MGFRLGFPMNMPEVTEQGLEQWFECSLKQLSFDFVEFNVEQEFLFQEYCSIDTSAKGKRYNDTKNS